MPRKLWFAFALLSLFILALVSARKFGRVSSSETGVPNRVAGASPVSTIEARLQKGFGQIPLYFIENRGQLDPQVVYYIQGHDTALYFTQKGVTFALTDRKSVARSGFEQASSPHSPGEAAEAVGRWAVKLDFVGANPDVKIDAGEKTPAVISYFKGRREQWKTGLTTYGSIVYSDLWPGIDLVYSGTSNNLKYTFLVKPGADPDQIRLAYRGTTGIRLGEGGVLEVETPAGGFRDEKPYSYQEIGERRVEVATAYRLDSSRPSDSALYGFQVSSYDRTQPLILDPVMLIYAGYIGGSGFDHGSGIAVDSAGNAYVTGGTDSIEVSFPVAVGPDLTFNGSTDAFVAKVNPAGTGLLYAGYIGGSSIEVGLGIAVDSVGNAYVAGYTGSNEATFPVVTGPDLTFNGIQNAFVAKVNAAGTALLYAGYIGGSGLDFGLGIAVDSAGNAYVTGQTGSDQTTFPVVLGPDLTYNGSADAFVAKVNAAGTALLYAGYIGGSSSESGSGIAVDSVGNAYVTGFTSSDQATFPVTSGPDLTYNGVSADAFVAKINPAGTGLLYAGYIGGGGVDEGSGIAADSAGNAYVTGWTNSGDFPVTVGPDLTYNGADAFVAKVNAAGTALLYSGYVGGAGFDDGRGIAVDSVGNAYVTGSTESAQATFPVTLGPDLTYNGAADAFVAKVNAAGTAFLYAGYIGGSGSDGGLGVAVDSAGTAYVTGFTASNEASFPVAVGPDLTFNGDIDGFVVKVGEVASSPTEGKAGGGGTLDTMGGIATFGFHVQRKTTGGPITGELRYRNHGTGDDVHAVEISSLAITAGEATFTGSCTNNGASCTFTVTVQDNGEPGSNDTFQISGMGMTGAGGPLRSGNIRVN